MSRWLVPACVVYRPLSHGNACLDVYFKNGQHGQLEGQAHQIYDAETALLEAMTERTPVDLSRWPSMRVRRSEVRVW